MIFGKYDAFNIFDKPIPYRNLSFYPVLMENYLFFHYFANCLLLDKNSIPDPKTISMSYLDYLYYATNEKENHILMFNELLRICLRKEIKPITRVAYDKEGRAVFEIDNELYDSNDFDTIREIIIDQNLLEPPDDSIQKEVREKLEETQRLKQKMNGNKMATLEEQMIAVAVYTGWDFEKICNLSIRKFIKTLQRSDLLLHYKIYLSASMSGMVEFKDKSFIKHWLSEIDEDKFDGTVDIDAMEEKINFSDKK